MEQAPAIEATPRRGLGDKARCLGRYAVATVGATLALMAAEPSATALAGPIPRQTITVNTDANVLAPGPVDPTLALPETGVATGGWNDDGLGSHTLFGDMAAEGMKVARLNWPADSNYSQTLPDIRAQVANARLNGIEVTINLQQPIDATAKDYPQRVAQMVLQLPGVTRFIPGNEWDSRFFSNLSVQDAARVNIKAAQAIHAARPDATVIGPGLSSDGDPVSDFETYNQVAAQCCGDLEKVFDEFDPHLYRTLLKNLQLLKTFEEDWEGPISIGEVGFLAKDPKQQAADEVAFTLAVAQDPQVERVYWYKYRTDPTDPFDTANVSANGVKRPAWYALRNLLTGQVTLPAPVPELP